MTFAAPPGYLSYGALRHQLVRETKCDVCHKPLLTANPAQKRHEGECMKIGRKRRAARRAAMRRVAA